MVTLQAFARYGSFLGYEGLDSLLERVFEKFSGFDDKNFLIIGDSLTDPGNLSNLTGGAAPGPGYINGNFTFGEMWSTQLAEDFDKSEATFFGSSPTELATAEIINTAIGGAATGSGSQPFGPDAGGLEWQIDRVGESIAQGLLNFDTGYIGTYWGGHNDYAIAVETGQIFQDFAGVVNEAIAKTVDGIATMIEDFGIDEVILFEMAPLEITPEAIAAGPSAQALGAAFTDAYNEGVLLSVEDFVEKSGIDEDIIEIFPTDEYFSAVVENPDFFGITNTTEPASDIFPGDPGPYEYVENPEGYAFIDGIHPNEIIHDLVADIIPTWYGYQQGIEDFPILERIVPDPIDIVVAAATFE